MMSTHSRDGSHLISEGDNLATLKNCEGYYTAKCDANSNPTSKVVGYAGSYTDDKGNEKKWVGLTYYNFSKADMWPAVLTYYAEQMANLIVLGDCVPDKIVGAPWAGVKFSQEVARLLGCCHIFAEKKGDEVILGRYENEIQNGEKILVGEELVNNSSTTGKLISLIESAGGHVIGIICAINRSYPFKDSFLTDDGRALPIIAVLESPTPQYKQDDPMVAKAIAEGRVVWKPKYDWQKLNE